MIPCSSVPSSPKQDYCQILEEETTTYTDILQQFLCPSVAKVFPPDATGLGRHQISPSPNRNWIFLQHIPSSNEVHHSGRDPCPLLQYLAVVC
ncbi:hypothetical protein Tsubulata_048955 [Turnera subulata]|uniref:Uncharacterized protein n=1 Tax=Turnera subulata TaxID=218843 RepID=A0A9Q0FUE5_9ROSI|nr:hypothetical protein Tsubulata_048955 [Turnera subulata]